MESVYLVLAAFQASNKRIASRTRVQKLTYFAAVSQGLDAGFRQHYYGPYSSSVSAALDTLVSVGAVEERNVRGKRENRFAGDDEGAAQSSYALTQVGEEFLELAPSRPSWFPSTVRSIEGVLGVGADDQTLACAAKLSDVAHHEGTPPDSETAKRHCEELQWELQPDDAVKALEILA